MANDIRRFTFSGTFYTEVDYEGYLIRVCQKETGAEKTVQVWEIGAVILERNSLSSVDDCISAASFWIDRRLWDNHLKSRKENGLIKWLTL